MAAKWLETLRKAHKTSIVQDGRRKIHFTFPDKNEMAEDYDLRSGELLVRKWKKKPTMGGQGKWEYEIGEHYAPNTLDTEGFRESSSNPVFVRRDTKKAFQWRIRNLPYPLDVYDVRVDENGKLIIIRTSNKKYYKKFNIPDMDRAELSLLQGNLNIAHANNTLIVSYDKPKEILEMEKAIQEEISLLKDAKDGDVECNPS